MNLPMVMPRPENIPYKVSDNYYNPGNCTRDTHKLVTPYNSEELMKTVALHKIKVPFDRIITRDMGFSVCPHCGTRYVGHELECQNKVTWYKTTETYSRWYKGERFVGERFKGDSYYGNVVSETKTGMCGSQTKWDLQEAFDLQVAFFDFVTVIGTLPEKPSDLMAQFGNCLPEGMEDKYRIALLERRAENHQMEISRCLGAIEQIAQKMQAAGNALCW